jgi:hypothetical protein
MNNLFYTLGLLVLSVNILLILCESILLKIIINFSLIKYINIDFI